LVIYVTYQCHDLTHTHKHTNTHTHTHTFPIPIMLMLGPATLSIFPAIIACCLCALPATSREEESSHRANQSKELRSWIHQPDSTLSPPTVSCVLSHTVTPRFHQHHHVALLTPYLPPHVSHHAPPTPSVTVILPPLLPNLYSSAPPCTHTVSTHPSTPWSHPTAVTLLLPADALSTSIVFLLGLL